MPQTPPKMILSEIQFANNDALLASSASIVSDICKNEFHGNITPETIYWNQNVK